MLPGNIDPRRPEKQQRYKPPPASNNAAPGEDLTPDYMNILDLQKQSMHTSHSRSDRFKVVKIESTEPFKRGRWECMDFLDQSYNRIFQHNSVTSDTIVNSSSTNSVGTADKPISRVQRSNNVDLQSSMLQIFYRQNSDIATDTEDKLHVTTTPPNAKQSVRESKEKYQNHVLRPGMVSSSLVGIKYPFELNFVIDEAISNVTTTSPIRRPLMTQSYAFPYKSSIFNRVCCCKSNPSNVNDCLFDRDVQKFQSMSSEQQQQSHQNLNYAAPQNHQDQINNVVSPAYNTSSLTAPTITTHVVDNLKQQTYVTEGSYQSDTYHVVNTTNTIDNSGLQSPTTNTTQNINYSTQNCNNDVHAQILINQNQNYCQITRSYQEQHQNNQCYVNNHIPNNTNNLVSNNNRPQSVEHLPLSPNNVTVNNNIIKQEIPNLNFTPAVNQEPEQIPVNYHTNESQMKTTTNICDNTILYSHESPVISGQNNFRTDSPTVIKNTSNVLPNSPKPNTTANDEHLQGVNVSFIPTPTTNVNENSSQNTNVKQQQQYYIPKPGPSLQNLYPVVYNKPNTVQATSTDTTTTQFLTEQPFFVSPYLPSSLVLPYLSNQYHMPLCVSSQVLPQNVLVTDQIPSETALNRQCVQMPQNAETLQNNNVQATTTIQQQPQDVSACVHAFLDDERAANGGETSGKNGSQHSIDMKIEALMDLVKKHLKCAVLEDVNILKQKILVLKERVAQLEYENELLRRCDGPNSYKDNV